MTYTVQVIPYKCIQEIRNNVSQLNLHRNQIHARFNQDTILISSKDSNELIFRRDAEENEENFLDEDDGVVDQVARDLIDTELSQV